LTEPPSEMPVESDTTLETGWPRPRTIVVAGPPGSGKTRYFTVTAFGVDDFNIDDRHGQILGSYRGSL
jgi:hypothetical protein